MDAKRPPLLVIDDDPGLRQQMRWALDAWEVVQAGDAESALVALRRAEPDVVTLDLGLPPDPSTPEAGFRLLSEILAIAPGTKVVAVTGQDDRANAVRAIGLGAYDFVAKPFDAETLALVLDRAHRLADLEREHRRLLEARPSEAIAGLLTRDPAMTTVCRQIERLAAVDATVALLGESGTGKELLARALHEGSPRRAGRFVAINCAAIPEGLLESELFGHERGAFTGAVKSTPGKVELADGGTLFLDEIGDLPMPLQAKLLRFLQERSIERIGGRAPIQVDVRVVCATHRNLRDRITEGTFREDLFYRLTEIVVTLPPLRDRIGDATLLAHAFVQRFAKRNGRDRMTLGDDALDAIAAHRWPGNVRELENAIKRSVIMAQGRTIHAADLGLAPAEDLVADPAEYNLRRLRDDVERRAVLTAMARCDGNVVRAADLLGVSRPTLYDLLRRFGLR
ncbi:MAG: PEP-CTERM-box response regulator transcription factor [Burkholderiales bacterium]|jgi:two-component system NtrC family response regulator